MTNLSMGLFQFTQAKIFTSLTRRLRARMRKYGQLQMVLFAESNIDLELPPEAKEKGLI